MKRSFLLVSIIGILVGSFGHVSALKGEQVELLFDDYTLRLDLLLHPEVIQQSPEQVITLGNIHIPVDLDGSAEIIDSDIFDLNTAFVPRVNEEQISFFLEESGILPGDTDAKVKIWRDDEGHITFEGRPSDGFLIDMESFTELMNKALVSKNLAVRVPAKKYYTDIVVEKDLADRGITEILAIGKSNFTGSSDNRRANIEAASRIFNGAIIPKGKRFSFNTLLEPQFTKEHGFTEELVIRGNDMEKELGGGVCQVSTTAFRAAYHAGLDIAMRRPHSFAVPYYMPHGIDAMIYLGVSDLRFENDTEGDILVQTMVEGDDLYFVFYGTRDDRKVSIHGPYVSNYKDLKEPKIIETDFLPRGEEQMISGAYRGFDTKWIREIEKDGEVIQEELVSYYKSFPAKILKGTGTPQKLVSR